jgi:DNA-binding transcriptional MerR regulator
VNERVADEVTEDSAPAYTLEELAKLAGVTPRTVRYYIGEGLLPPAVSAGPNSGYTEEHRDRLRLIARLKDAYVPLREIKRRLDGLSDADIDAALADPGRGEGTAPSAGATDLWRRLSISDAAELLITNDAYQRERPQVDAALALLRRVLG